MEEIKKVINYDSGGKLLIYQNNQTQYVPSSKYLKYRKEHYEKLNKYKDDPHPISFKRIREYNRKKLLFTKQECPIVNRFLNKILKMYEVFDFTGK